MPRPRKNPKTKNPAVYIGLGALGGAVVGVGLGALTGQMPLMFGLCLGLGVVVGLAMGA